MVLLLLYFDKDTRSSVKANLSELLVTYNNLTGLSLADTIFLSGAHSRAMLENETKVEQNNYC